MSNKKYPTLHKLSASYPLLETIEKSIGLPQHLTVLISFLIFFSFIFWGIGMSLFITTFGFLYPIYRSFKALKYQKGKEVQYWVKFWIIWMLLSTCDSFSDTAFSWVPFYYLIKTSFLIWCFIPEFQGANSLYDSLVRPILVDNEEVIEASVEDVQIAIKTGASHIGSKVRKSSIQVGNTVVKKGKELVKWTKQLAENEIKTFNEKKD